MPFINLIKLGDKMTSNMKFNFETLEELSELLEGVGLRIHMFNRISYDDSEYVWQLAETLRKTALLAQLLNKFPRPDDILSSCYNADNVEEDDIEQKFLELLRNQKTN
jgi:hypothetical protein